MKLDARQIAGFCRDPGGTRVVLLHGEDEGLIRERAQSLTRNVAGSLNDPFLVAELTRENWARLPSEVAALSMIGGRRVVVVRDAGDSVLPFVMEAMRGLGAALVILEALGLSKGKLRSFVETAPDGVAIACYAEEGRALADTIRAGLAEAGLTVDNDALVWLAQVLGGDRAVVRGEIEKLALLGQPGGRITLELAQSCVGEVAASYGDDGVLAATSGDVTSADAAIETALADGLNGVALMRMTVTHLQKMHQAKLRMQSGLSPGDAVRAIRPPVFYKTASAITSALSVWSADQLQRALEEARRLELACKQTGGKPELLARRFLQSLARAAQLKRQRAA